MFFKKIIIADLNLIGKLNNIDCFSPETFTRNLPEELEFEKIWYCKLPLFKILT